MLPGLEMRILWRFRWRSREANIPAAWPILLHAKGELCFYAENWERSQEKPEWINPMQNALLGSCSHPGWASQVKWNEEGIRLSQRRDKHMECSKNLKHLTMARAMNTKEKHGGALGKRAPATAWKVLYVVLLYVTLFILQTTST